MSRNPLQEPDREAAESGAPEGAGAEAAPATPERPVDTRGSGGVRAADNGPDQPRPERRERYRARVSLDRFAPSRTVTVDEFRVNETLRDRRGVPYVWLHAAEGTFKVPFDVVREIAFESATGRTGAAIRYEATITWRDGQRSRRGRMELSSLRGTVDGLPWHVVLAARDDRGTNLYRIEFIE